VLSRYNRSGLVPRLAEVDRRVQPDMHWPDRIVLGREIARRARAGELT
jgi:hypothetical protein